jgi:hypothetical protein
MILPMVLIIDYRFLHFSSPLFSHYSSVDVAHIPFLLSDASLIFDFFFSRHLPDADAICLVFWLIDAFAAIFFIAAFSLSRHYFFRRRFHFSDVYGNIFTVFDAFARHIR